MRTPIPALTPGGPVVIVAPLSGGPDLSHSAGFAPGAEDPAISCPLSARLG
jgi:hypothetical protein